MQNWKDFFEIRTGKLGNGLFALRDIPTHTILLQITGKPVEFIDSLNYKDKESYCLQTTLNSYIFLDEPFCFANHSCMPNCGISNSMEMLTLHTIKKNEELRWDYSTSMLERYWQHDCKCGTPQCRRIIKDFDTMPPEFQERYIKMGIVMPFIVEYLAELKAAPEH